MSEFTRGMHYAMTEVVGAVSSVTDTYRNPADYPQAVFKVLRDIASALAGASRSIKERAKAEKAKELKSMLEGIIPDDPFEELREGEAIKSHAPNAPGVTMAGFKKELAKIPEDAVNWVVGIISDKYGRNCLLGDGLNGSQEVVDALRNAADTIERGIRQKKLQEAAQNAKEMASAPPKALQH